MPAFRWLKCAMPASQSLKHSCMPHATWCIPLRTWSITSTKVFFQLINWIMTPRPCNMCQAVWATGQTATYYCQQPSQPAANASSFGRSNPGCSPYAIAVSRPDAVAATHLNLEQSHTCLAAGHTSECNSLSKAVQACKALEERANTCPEVPLSAHWGTNCGLPQ